MDEDKTDKTEQPDDNFLSGIRGRMDGVFEGLTEKAKRYLGENSEGSPKPGVKAGTKTKPLSRDEQLVERYQKLISRILETPMLLAHVFSVPEPRENKKPTVVISCNGRFAEVLYPEGLTLEVGAQVRINAQTSQIVDLAPASATGTIATIRRVIDDLYVEANLNNSLRIAVRPQALKDIQEGDRVVLDTTGQIVLLKAGDDDRKYKLGAIPSTTWDDIIGQEDAKKALIAAIVAPFKNKELWDFYKKKHAKGFLFSGPPGCGKTMLGEAAATELLHLHGEQAIHSGYFYVKGPEFLDMYVGNAEKAIRDLYVFADKHFEKYGFPAIIVLDEAEALLSRRGSGKNSDMEKTIVPTFLGCMNHSTAITLLLTNRPDTLDPAVIRAKRVNRTIKIKRPTRKDAEAIFVLNLRQTVIAKGETVESLAASVASEFYDLERYGIMEFKLKSGATVRFGLAHLNSGAMSAGLIDQAVDIAMERDITAGTKTGVGVEDLKAAVRQLFDDKKNLNHDDELNEYRDEVKEPVESGRLLIQASK